MANATSVTSRQGTMQLRGIFKEMWRVNATMNVGSLDDGVGETNTIAVPGVALGDVVLGVSMKVDLAGITVNAYVSAANTVSVRFQNESGGTVDLASTTIVVVVGRPAWL